MKNAGYLFCFFTGKEKNEKDEQVYFALSRDGLHWEDLNGQKPLLCSEIGTKGVRDPFLIRLEDKKKYIIIATDLHIASGTSWEEAVHNGSTKLVCWESSDLLHWSEPYFFDTEMADAGCVWAPEAVYDRENGCYMVFWFFLTERNGEKRHRVYASRTKDFHNFSKAFLYLEKDTDIIDMTIVYEDGEYYRFYKDEENAEIHMDHAKRLMDKFIPVEKPFSEKPEGVEGPAVFPLGNKKGWCLLLDYFREQKGYVPFVTEKLSGAKFKELPEECYNFGRLKKRHGSILNLTQEEWSRFEKLR